MNTKIFKKENAKLAPASFITGHQKVVMCKVSSGLYVGIIANAEVALLFAFGHIW